METIATCLGVLLFAGAFLLGATMLCRRARSADLLAPVVVGGLLRLGVMLIAHLGSVQLGDGGLMFLDDRTYFQRGELLAAAWRMGEVIDPAAYNYAGSYQFGYPALLGGVFTLVGHSILPAKLLNVLAGAATVLVVALLSRRLLGEASARRAAWAAALFPTLVWWSAPLMKEAVTTLLVVSVLLAASHLPKRSAAGMGTALLGALFLTRTGAAAAVALGAFAAIGVAAARSPRIGWVQWVKAVGGFSVITFVALLGLSQGDLPALQLQYRSTIDSMIELYQGSNPLAVPLDSMKTLVTPLPWVFDVGTRNWDRGLYPGVWTLILVYPLAAVGVWRMRRKPELALLLVPLASSVVLNAFTSGFPFRQRSVVEPLILLLAVAGTKSYRQAAVLGAVVLAIVAPVALLQSRSALTGAVIAVSAGALWLASRRLPATEMAGVEAPSALIASFRSGDQRSGERRLRQALDDFRQLIPTAAPLADPRIDRLRSQSAALGRLATSPSPLTVSPALERGLSWISRSRQLAPPLPQPKPRRPLKRDAAPRWKAITARAIALKGFRRDSSE